MMRPTLYACIHGVPVRHGMDCPKCAGAALRPAAALARVFACPGARRPSNDNTSLAQFHAETRFDHASGTVFHFD